MGDKTNIYGSSSPLGTQCWGWELRSNGPHPFAISLNFSSKLLRTLAYVLGRIELWIGSASLARFSIRHLHDPWMLPQTTSSTPVLIRQSAAARTLFALPFICGLSIARSRSRHRARDSDPLSRCIDSFGFRRGVLSSYVLKHQNLSTPSSYDVQQPLADVTL